MRDVQTIKEAAESYTHSQCIVKVETKTGVFNIVKEFFRMWGKDPDIRRYNHKEWYPPPLISDPDDFNLWDGLDIEKSNNIDDGTGRDYWSKFKIFALNLFGDAKVNNYILSR